MTLAELKQKDPERYKNLEAKAQQLGYIAPGRTLESIPWLVDLVDLKIRGVVEPFVGYHNRFMNAHRSDTSRNSAVETVAAAANRQRQLEANTGERGAAAPATYGLTHGQLKDAEKNSANIANRHRSTGSKSDFFISTGIGQVRRPA